jgi:hypothetical protein
MAWLPISAAGAQEGAQERALVGVWLHTPGEGCRSSLDPVEGGPVDGSPTDFFGDVSPGQRHFLDEIPKKSSIWGCKV